MTRVAGFIAFGALSALGWWSFVSIFGASTASIGGIGSAFFGVLCAIAALLSLKPRKAQK